MASPVDDIALHALLEPERLAAVELEGERRWSYRELDADVSRCSAVLAARGCKPGDRIATIARNAVLLPVLHFACARIGAVFCPLSLRLAPREIDERLADAEPRLLLTDGSLPGRLQAELSLDALRSSMKSAAPLAAPPPDPDRPSLLLFTSGTSGRPKGALLTERNLRESAINFSQLGRVDRRSRFLGDAPMFHVIGLVSNVRPALMQGGAMLVSTGFDPDTTLSRLADAELGITHYFCVPQMLAALRSRPNYRPEALRDLTAVFTGGAPHPASQIRALLDDGVTVADGFGMTEVGAVFGMPLQPSIIARKAGSVGVSTPRVETLVVDDAGNPCPVGVPGELLIRGDNVSPGYLGLDATEGRTADGWFHTGDVVRVDEDGFHYVVDRKKDMFITGGENVYPAEIEAQLADYPGVAELAVVGVPNAKWGEVGHLAVVAVTGHVLDLDAMLESLDDKLGRYKIPRHASLLDSLPRTGSGKLRKQELRALLTAQS